MLQGRSLRCFAPFTETFYGNLKGAMHITIDSVFYLTYHCYVHVLQVTIDIDNQKFQQEFNENQPVPRMITPGGVIFIYIYYIVQVTIDIDNQEFQQEFNENQPVPRMITPGGVIFIGGMANVRKYTNGQSTDNLEGSVKSVNMSFLTNMFF